MYEDYKLQRFLQNYIKRNNHHPDLHSLLRCNRRAISDKGVTLLSNGKESRLAGLVRCKNGWCCPVCEATVMNRTAINIGAAIDMLKSEGLIGFMITFTVWHVGSFPLAFSLDNLQKTFARFNHLGSSFKNNNRAIDVFANFRAEHQLKYFVRCTEVTYSQMNGWHPHIHAIFWAPKDKFKAINANLPAIEEKLRATWRKIMINTIKKNAPKYLPNTTNFDKFVDKMIAASPEPGLYISKKHGTEELLPTESGWYLSGWGGNDELTGNRQRKATSPKSVTPRQLLEMAAKIGLETNNYYADLYLDYCLAVKHRIRVHWSKNDIYKRVQEYKLSKNFKRLTKKNSTSEPPKKWQPVCWFPLPLWKQICEIDEIYPLKLLILAFGTSRFALSLITELLEEFDLSPPLKTSPYEEAILKAYNAYINA